MFGSNVQNQAIIRNEDCIQVWDIYTPFLYKGWAKEHWAYNEHDTCHKEISFTKSTVLTVLYLVHRDTFFQNETEVITNTKKFYYKMCLIFYSKMRQFKSKMQQSLKNTLVLLENVTVRTK